MTGLPRVSCIMIFRNAERFMTEAIESVLAQSVSSWELLLVDDGSSDASTTIARTYAARHPERIRYCEHPRHEHRGMSASRNLGIAHARGEFIGFLDSDDVWLPHKLAAHTAILDAHPDAAMVYGPSQYWHGWTDDPADAARDHYGDLCVPPDALHGPGDLLALGLETGGGSMPGICSVLVRREMVAEVGGFEESFRGCYEDQVFLCKVFLRAVIFVTGTCSDRYRQHPWSSCVQAMRTGEYHPVLPHRARRTFLEWLRWYLAAEGCADPRVLAALQRNLLPYDHPLLYGSLERLRYARAHLRRWLVTALSRLLPGRVYRWLRARRHAGQWVPPVGLVRFGSLRRRGPLNRSGGAERGRPIDRHYVDDSLAGHAEAVRGTVLEVGTADVVGRLGGTGAVEFTRITLDENLEHRLEALPSAAFDCIVCANVLQRVYDVRAIMRALVRRLRPGGVLLATLPGAGSIGAPSTDTTYWGFTVLSVRTLFEEVFPAQKLVVESRGSVLTATALLHGIAADELRANELAHRDADYPVVITVRAERPTGEWEATRVGRWQYANREPFAYGDDTTYRKGMAFLDGHGTIEDWGAGAGYARRFIERSPYRGIDGSPSLGVECIADLRDYQSDVDCIFMRHVLEHNADWGLILDNALRSFRKRMVLVVFTPFAARTREIGSWSGIPDLAFRKRDLVDRFGDLVHREETLVTGTQYGREHIFYLERRVTARRSA
jgi:glycosyltransferase involved in cell wall biosynthesis/SAM-dependent methyltransferase